MSADPEDVLKFWKRVTAASVVIAICSIGCMLLFQIILTRPVSKIDDRLLGTWQSDGDRTIAGMKERKPLTAEQEAGLRSIFGKLRITYTRNALTTDLDGKTEKARYEFLGSDKHSAVIRTIKENPSTLESALELSEYWIYTQIGGIKEYFKRVR
jgi:hypothetical protein